MSAENQTQMNTTEELIADLQQGKMVILIDDEHRENEGDLVMAAQHITADHINFMAAEARGLICLSLTSQQTQQLGLPLMVTQGSNSAFLKTAFTVSIEAAEGVTTGISAQDRAHTVQAAIGKEASSSDIVMPGHIFPIQAQDGGVLKRAGHTEASVDLARLAGLDPSAVICEIMNTDGTMARVPALKEFAKKHNLKIGTIESLIEYRLRNESFMQEKARVPLSREGENEFEIVVFENTLNKVEHIALVKGEIDENSSVLVRVHKSNLVEDLFSPWHNVGRNVLARATEMIEQQGSGIIVYLNESPRPSRIEQQVREHGKKVKGEQIPFVSDSRNYGVGAQILRALGVKRMQLLTSHSPAEKKVALKGWGIEIVDTINLTTSEERSATETWNNH